MTQAYLKGSTGWKSMEAGLKSDTGGAHGGSEDEGPCRYPRDDHNKAQPSTPKGYGRDPFPFLTSLFGALVGRTAQAELCQKKG